MGVDLVRAALQAGHFVVATARDAAKVTAALGEQDHLLPVSLDVTDPAAAQAAVDAAVARFGRIDVLVNNAGNFYAGFFEEISDAQFRAQLETNFFGPLNVTRAVLPVMRSQRSGKVVDHHLDGRDRRRGVLRGLCGVEVRPRGLDGVAAVRPRAVRYLDHRGGARLLPYRAARRRSFVDLAGAVDRRLRRADRCRPSRAGRA